MKFLWAAEALLGRVTKRVILCDQRTRRGISKATDLQRFSLPEDVLATVTVCPAGNLIALVTKGQMVGMGALIREIFEKRNGQFQEAKAKEEYGRLEKVEQDLAAATPDYLKLQQELGSEWGELMFFDIVNVTFDKLGAGVCDVLARFPDLTRGLPARCHEVVRELAGLGVNYADKCCDIIGKKPMAFEPDEIERRRKRIFEPFPNGC